jgi:hypothetical protein
LTLIEDIIALPGDVFVIDYKNVVSLNLTFVVSDQTIEDIKSLPD